MDPVKVPIETFQIVSSFEEMICDNSAINLDVFLESKLNFSAINKCYEIAAKKIEEKIEENVDKFYRFWLSHKSDKYSLSLLPNNVVLSIFSNVIFFSSRASRPSFSFAQFNHHIPYDVFKSVLYKTFMEKIEKEENFETTCSNNESLALAWSLADTDDGEEPIELIQAQAHFFQIEEDTRNINSQLNTLMFLYNGLKKTMGASKADEVPLKLIYEAIQITSEKR